LQKASLEVTLKVRPNPAFPMHNPNPYKLTDAEWRELGSLPVIRESWGLEEEQDPLDLASLAYGARFDFVSGSPGYVGNLYFLSRGCFGGADGPSEK
jgi:hypothetical protein